jgi:hypothetical protein
MRRTKMLQEIRKMRFEEVYIWMERESVESGGSGAGIRTGEATAGIRPKRGQGEQNADHPVRPRHETLGDSDDRGLFSRSQMAK